MSDDPIKRFTLLVLLQAQQDHATELTVAPAASGRSAMKYQVEGTWHDFSPPPAGVVPGVLEELERMAGFKTRPFPREGLIDVWYAGSRLLWIVRMASPNTEVVLRPVEQ